MTIRFGVSVWDVMEMLTTGKRSFRLYGGKALPVYTEFSVYRGSLQGGLG